MIKLISAAKPFKKKRDIPSAAKVTPTPTDEEEEESRNAAATTVSSTGFEAEKARRARGSGGGSGEPSTTMARLNLADPTGALGAEHEQQQCDDGGAGNERRRQEGEELRGSGASEGSIASADGSTSKGTGSVGDSLGDGGGCGESASSSQVPLSKLGSDSSSGTDRRRIREPGQGDGGGGGVSGIHDYHEQSPGLASVDTAASTQPPPSPLHSPGVGGGAAVAVGEADAQSQQQQRTVPAGVVWSSSSSPWGTGVTTASTLPASRPPLPPDEDAAAHQQRQQQARLHRRSLSWEDGGGGGAARGPYPLHRTASSGENDDGAAPAAGRSRSRRSPVAYPVQQQAAQQQQQWLPSMQPQQQQQQPSSPSAQSWNGQQLLQQYEYQPREFIPARHVGKGGGLATPPISSAQTSPLSLSPSLSPGPHQQMSAMPPLHLGAVSASGPQQQAQAAAPPLPSSSLPPPQSQRQAQQQQTQQIQRMQMQQLQQLQQQQQQQQQPQHYQQQPFSTGLYQMQAQQQQQQRQPGQYNLQPRPSPSFPQQQQTGTRTPPRGGGGGHWGGPGGGALSQQQPSPTSAGAPGSPGMRPSTGGHGPSSTTSGGHRSSPEVLKTLLRKKACLYEPHTSHAVALVTWLVGRRLALSQGYFSRQHLQSGVHDVVSRKIESGVITRTKVNRCMQIILNSCFHYIIPRPDGTEEDGGAFRESFARSCAVRYDDEVGLLRTLPAPWNDLEVEVFDGIAADGAASGDGAAEDGGAGGGAGKRSVLLCFNENVRSARDVFKCHNEFVRDAAHGANLLLTAEEWRSFYSGSPDDHHPHPSSTYGGVKGGGGDSATSSPTTSSGGMSVSPASLSPPLRPATGAAIQPPVFTFDSSSSSPSLGPAGWAAAPPAVSLLPRVREETLPGEERANAAPPTPVRGEKPETGDVLGEMSASDLATFRTTWCAKRYDHDPAVCGFAHVDVNGGWLRRDPALHPYKPEMCPDVRPAATANSDGEAEMDGCSFNSCRWGTSCPLAHSAEEVEYHPDAYKVHACRSRPCRLRDVCPNLHPPGAASAQYYQQHHPSQFGGHHQQHGSSRPTWHRRDHGSAGGRGGGGGGSREPHAAGGPGGRGHQAPPASSSSQQPHHYPGGAPTMYVGPAPESEFDRSLLLPGLRGIFRRRSASLYAYYRGGGDGRAAGVGKDQGSAPVSLYSNFGDDWGLDVPGTSPA